MKVKKKSSNIFFWYREIQIFEKFWGSLPPLMWPRDSVLYIQMSFLSTRTYRENLRRTPAGRPAVGGRHWWATHFSGKGEGKNPRYRIRELSKVRRPLMHLLVTGRPAEPEPKRGRCSAGPAFSHGGVFDRQAPQTKRDQTDSLLQEKNLR